ncbi:kinase domain protein [Coprinopsis sp. MPI-PUGE-AT-0042]|nr:kinase domain protein [Coprinopsis sp. MPI-PUGE-AT-0042]
MAALPAPEYDWIDGAEDLGMYVPGGYHPVELGDLLHGRYRIMDKLGFGGYSTVWLARDTIQEHYVAVKVCLADLPSNETKILRDISLTSESSPVHPGRNSVPPLLDEFVIEGPNGAHACYTTLPTQGNLRDVSFSRLFTLEVARALSAGLAQALAYTHSRGYIHGDVHLSNVLVPLPASFQQLSVEEFWKKYESPETVRVTRRDGKELPPNVPKEAVLPLFMGDDAEKMVISEARVILNDFGEAFAPDSDVRLGKHCHTPLASRPPEARFEPEAPLSYSADIWSLATAIWDILGMQAVFWTEFAPEDHVISQYIDLLGPMPRAWWVSWEGRFEYFDDQGLSKEKRVPRQPLEQEFELCVQEHREKRNMSKYDKDEAAAILRLMRRMLVFQPEERLTCNEVLESEWMVKWALPELRRAEEASRATAL